MPRGPGKTLKCVCGACKICKDRLRCRAISAGTFKPYVAQGRAAERLAAAKRAAKERAKAEAEEIKARAEPLRAKQRAWRDRRSYCFKKNRDRYGLKRAKWIAQVVTWKQKMKKALFDGASTKSSSSVGLE